MKTGQRRQTDHTHRQEGGNHFDATMLGIRSQRHNDRSSHLLMADAPVSSGNTQDKYMHSLNRREQRNQTFSELSFDDTPPNFGGKDIEEPHQDAEHEVFEQTGMQKMEIEDNYSQRKTSGEEGLEVSTEVKKMVAPISSARSKALTHARVPIVKLMDPVTGLSCDICVNNLLAVVNTKLLKDYAQIDVRLRQLVFIVKHWAKSRRVNETYQGTLSSYAYVLMCIHFLQLRRPAILPCLQTMNATYNVTVENTKCAYFDQVERLREFGARNKESIARLLWSFFQYWAYHHDYTNDVISIRTGSFISKEAKDWTRRIGNDRHLICIEDPFNISHDLGRVVDKYTIKILREEFERAAEIMQYDPTPSVTLFQPYVPGSPQS